jgi:hypothetical protein
VDPLERYGLCAHFSFPENEIFVRDVNGTVTRITNDEANRVPPVDDREPAIAPMVLVSCFTKRDAQGNDDLYITSALLDFSRPGAAPQQFKLVGDISGTPSMESHPSWSPDGKSIVFQSTRGPLGVGQTEKDYDIYIVTVPTTFNASSALPTPIRLTLNPGDDVEPSIGPVQEVSRAVRPNGQLVYASNRDDLNNNEDQLFTTVGQVRGPDVEGKPTYTSEVSRTYDFGEDYDIYLQDLSLENTTTNRSQRIVDSPRQVFIVIGGAGDGYISGLTGNLLIESNGNDNADDDYFLGYSFSGDDRRPVMSADGSEVIFCSDSIFSDQQG